MTQRRQLLVVDRVQQAAGAKARGADQLRQGDIDLMLGFGEDFVALVAAIEVDLPDLDPGFGLPAFDHRFAEVFLPGQQRQVFGRVHGSRGKQQADRHQQGAAHTPWRWFVVLLGH
nr:hypothetical protein [Stutzerimonas kunmingensis]